MEEAKKEIKKISIKRYYDVLPKSEFSIVKTILLSESGYRIQISDSCSEFLFFYRELDKDHLEWIWPFVNKHYGDYAIENNIDFNQIKLERLYINCQPSHHPGDWHQDNESGFTLLYYPDLGIDFGSEAGLEFKGYGIEPHIPNSVLIFPADVLHRAHSHTQIGKIRFSIAIKFKIVLPIPEKE